MVKNLRVLPLVTITSILLFLLSGCWIPEDFDCKVKVTKNGSYTFTYNGTLTFAPALAAAKEGSLSQKDEAELKEEGEKLRSEPGFKDVNYIGKGRYKVLVEKVGKPGEPYYFLSDMVKIFAIQPQKDGSVRISATRPSKKDIAELKSMGAKMAGTLTVSVAQGVKVVKHNAESEPKVFGLFGGYKWKIESPDADPIIIVKPDTPAPSSSNEIWHDGVYTAYVNGIVRNTETGLEWVTGPKKRMTPAEGRDWAKGLTIDGGGWRIPTTDEMVALTKSCSGRQKVAVLLEPSEYVLCDTGKGQLFFYLDKEGAYHFTNVGDRVIAVRFKSGR